MATKPAEIAAQGKWTSQLIPRWTELAGQPMSLDAFMTAAIQVVAQISGIPHWAIVQGTKGQWRILSATTSELQSLPIEFLSDVLDAGQPLARHMDGKPTAAAPLPLQGSDGCLLLSQSAIQVDELSSVAAAFSLIHRAAARISAQVRRANRMQALLNVSAHWSQADDLDRLLEKIAESSTQLLEAERASIFLIDPIRNLLIGKPALGVESGELLIPIDAGVVGRAIATGLTHRVDDDVAVEQAMVDRQVDQRLNFQTRSLLCVPMRDSQGKTIGAFELINKRNGRFSDEDELDLQELAIHAAAAIENGRRVEQLVTSRQQITDQAASQVHLIGQSPGIVKIRETIQRIAPTELAILITGENGTGKEIVAQMIHYMSLRRDQVMVAVNCAAIAETLLESELFGHEKGAFTDAHQRRPGKFELASRGTLFLDEIGDMSLAGQAKLLRVLEEKVVVRVGGSTPIPTQSRVVAATNQNLSQLVRDRKFREDLFFRLNVMTIEIPPLRERGEDVIELAEHFLRLFSVNVRRRAPSLSASARKRLLSHAWPGNVRELRNMMERLVYLAPGDTIAGDELPFISAPSRKDDGASYDGMTLAAATDKFQSELIRRQIQMARGNMTEAAERLGLHRSNLYRKMRQLGIDNPPASL
ncbi:MAG TPA: sigma-54-dependent Fis family transcriptional regulator [Pirellulaceae bacterium]|nr:sigma-54-dependent Fis family transcriptional regulator [Pirellulaceae bacterium]